MAGCVLYKRLYFCPTWASSGSIIHQMCPSLRGSSTESSMLKKSSTRGFITQRCTVTRAGRRLAVLCSSSSTVGGFSSESWDTVPKNSESLSNAVPIPERPGEPPKKRYIAGVDQTDRVEPWMLADRDSRFAEFYGVKLHYKIEHPPSDSEASGAASEVSKAENSANRVPAVLLHGFGASIFSWERVLKPLAAVIASKVVAFDRPAFGLSSRLTRKAFEVLSLHHIAAVKPISVLYFTSQVLRLRFVVPKRAKDATTSVDLNPFSLDFSAAATVAFVDFLQAQQVLLIGHSAGCLVALQAYLDAPEKIAGLILVAPALAAPIIIGEMQRVFTTPDSVMDPDSPTTQSDAAKQEISLSKIISSLQTAIWWVVSQVLKVLRVIKAGIQALFQTLVPRKIVSSTEAAIKSAREKFIGTIFQSPPAIWAVRFIMDKFGTRAVRMAWFDSKKADEYVIDGYTKPLRCKGWERALLEFTLAMIVKPATGMQPKDALGKRLKEITCPVLVITGDTDRLVPAWNARRLANALPNAQFALIKECGHLPQEETPEEFLSLVKDFMAQVYPKHAETQFSYVPT